jgi:hypothetical protein
MTTVLYLMFLSGLAWMIHEWAHAPIGYEDETGFHYGRRP